MRFGGNKKHAAGLTLMDSASASASMMSCSLLDRGETVKFLKVFNSAFLDAV